jgi:hypothetical protein
MYAFLLLSRISFRSDPYFRYQSQTKDYGVMDTDEFAAIVVGKISSPKPPQYLSIGGFTTKMWILKWLPRTTAEALIWYLAQQEPKPGTYGPV